MGGSRYANPVDSHPLSICSAPHPPLVPVDRCRVSGDLQPDNSHIDLDMNETRELTPDSATVRPEPQERAFPLWRRLLLVATLAVAFAGLGIQLLASSADGEGVTSESESRFEGGEGSSSTPRTLGNTLAPSAFDGGVGDGRLPTQRNQEALESAEGSASGDVSLGEWGGFLSKLGFSFVVGLSIGLALTFFLRVTLVLFGLLFLALFGLQYVEIIEVRWDVLEAHYDSMLQWLTPRLDSFRDFIVSNLPASGSAALGLLAGLKRR